MYAENGDAVRSDSFIFQVSDAAGDHTAAQLFSIAIQGAPSDLIWPSDGSGTDLLASGGPAADQTFTFDDVSALIGGAADAAPPSASDAIDPIGSAALDSELSSSDFTAYWDLLHPTSSSSGDCQG